MISDILTAIKAESGLKAKQEMLRSHMHNADLLDILFLTYSPSVNFGVVELKPNAHGDKKLEDFIIRLKAGGLSREQLQEMLDSLDKDNQPWMQRMLNGNLGIGIAATSINAVLNYEFIWDSSKHYMRCSLPTKKAIDSFDWDMAIVQEKFDGSYCEMGAFGLRTRNGNIYPSIHPLHMYSGFFQGILMGELVCYRDDNAMPREESNGILNSLMQGTEPSDDIEIRYHVWDWKANDDGECDLTYNKRLAKVQDIVDSLALDTITCVDYQVVQSFDEAKAIAIDFIKQGKEGAVAKERMGIWAPTTSKQMMKLKAEAECDLRVKELVAGDALSKHASTFGSIRCESEDGRLVVDVSGFTDKQRETIAASPAQYIGKIVAVKFNNIMPADGAKPASLFLPRIQKDGDSIMIRDKDEADTLERIQEIIESGFVISGEDK